MEGTTAPARTSGGQIADASSPDASRHILELSPAKFVPRLIRLSDIDRDPTQPRVTERSAEEQEELNESVSRNGLFSTLTVSPRPDGRFVLIAGEGRLTAALANRITEAVCLVAEPPLTPAEVKRIQFEENTKRTPLSPLDQGFLFRSLMKDHGWSQSRVAKFLGVSQGHVSEYVKLTRLSDDLKARVARGTLGVRQALRSAERARSSAADISSPNPEPAPSPFDRENPLDGVTVHPAESWVDSSTRLMFVVGRRSKRPVTDDELLRAMKKRVKELEAKLACSVPTV